MMPFLFVLHILLHSVGSLITLISLLIHTHTLKMGIVVVAAANIIIPQSQHESNYNSTLLFFFSSRI